MSSREIKFREWEKDLKIMYYDDKVGLWDAALPSLNMQISGTQQSEHYILMQYTGLKDKHGKDIYEGDIVRTENEQYGDYPCKDSYQGVVTYRGDSYHIVQPHASYQPTLQNLTIASIEVIGNIYEHPHLLEEVAHE